MASLKDMAESRGTIMNFDPRKLKVKTDLNARDLAMPDNEAHIQGLSESIAMEGVKIPLTIFQEEGDVFVADGHCRLAATMRAIANGADIKTVPCIPELRGTNDIDRVLSQNIYNSGKALTPIEQGVNFRKALALGSSVSEIAKKVGKSISYVSQMIDFQAAPQAVHAMVKSGEVSATLAAKVIRENGNAAGLQMLKEASNETKGKRVTAKAIAAPDKLWAELQSLVKSKRPSGLSDADLREVIRTLED
jgi:ParB-like chromosome segregation protein Spo0J